MTKDAFLKLKNKKIHNIFLNVSVKRSKSVVLFHRWGVILKFPPLSEINILFSAKVSRMLVGDPEGSFAPIK